MRTCTHLSACQWGQKCRITLYYSYWHGNSNSHVKPYKRFNCQNGRKQKHKAEAQTCNMFLLLIRTQPFPEQRITGTIKKMSYYFANICSEPQQNKTSVCSLQLPLCAPALLINSVGLLSLFALQIKNFQGTLVFILTFGIFVNQPGKISVCRM